MKGLDELRGVLRRQEGLLKAALACNRAVLQRGMDAKKTGTGGFAQLDLDAQKRAEVLVEQFLAISLKQLKAWQNLGDEKRIEDLKPVIAALEGISIQIMPLSPALNQVVSQLYHDYVESLFRAKGAAGVRNVADMTIINSALALNPDSATLAKLYDQVTSDLDPRVWSRAAQSSLAAGNSSQGAEYK